MLKFASSIGFALALAEMKQRVRRLVTQGILGAVGAVFFLIGFCFLLAAAHLWLSRLLDPIASAAIIGGALIFVALVLFLIASAKGKRRAPPPPPLRENPLGDAARDGMARLGEAIGSGQGLKNPALLVAGLALVAGFLLGRRGGGDKD